MYFDFLYNFCLKHFSVCEELSEILSYMCIGIHESIGHYSIYNNSLRDRTNAVHITYDLL